MTDPDRPAHTVRELIRSDIERHTYMLDRDGTARVGQEGSLVRDLRSIVMAPGLQATIVYRLGHGLVGWQPSSRVGRVAKAAGRVGHFAASKVVEATTGIWIAERADIGPGLYIGHFSGIMVTACEIGANCNLSQGVTIGESGQVDRPGTPVIGDRVWIGPGAVVSGPISVGDDAVIGANSVVTKSVPERSAAIGNPSTIRPGRDSSTMILYPGMDRDPSRTAGRPAGEDVSPS